MAGKEEVVYEEVELDELKSEETKLKGNPTTRSRNISGGGAVTKRAVHPSESLSKGKLLCIIVCVALLVAISSIAITAIIFTMNFDSRLREMALDISLKHGGVKKIISALNNSLVDVQASIVDLQNKSNHDIFKEDNSRYEQHINEVIDNLLVQYQHDSTTLLRHDALLKSLNDSLMDLRASTVELRNDSRHYKEIINRTTVQHNNEATDNLLAQSQHCNTSLLRHDEVLTSLNDSLVDLHAAVVELRNDSRHYKESNNINVQHNNEAINSMLQAIDKLSSSLEQRVYQAMHDEKNVRKQFQNKMQTDFKTEKENMEIKFTSLNITLSAVIDNKLETIENKVHMSVTMLNGSIASIEDIQASLVELQIDSHRYKEDNSRSVQHNNEAITTLLVQSQHSNTTLVRQNAVLASLNDSLVDLQASVVDIRNESRHYKEDNSRSLQHTNEAITNLLAQSQYSNTTLLKHDAVLTSLNELFVDLQESVIVLYKEHTENTDYEDCYDIHKQTNFPSGLYIVKPNGLNRKVTVMCDMDTTDGGWTVFQYRYDGSVDFYHNFSMYENGFGKVAGEFWLGLRYIQAIASSAPTTLRVEMEAADGDKAYQTFEDFSLEGPDYKLNIGYSSGTAGDDGYGLSYSSKGKSFSTHDRDRDGRGGYNCAEYLHGGWWYRDCGYVNLNGYYTTPGTTSDIGGAYSAMFYYSYKQWNSLKSSKMMIRRN